MHPLAPHIEALIFATDQPVTFDELVSCLREALGQDFAEAEVREALEALHQRYADPAFAFEIVEVAEGYQFMTKGAYHPVVATWLKQTTRKRLSRAALETLAIIAYKQPVTKGEVEQIRGVNCDYTIQKLLEKELVAIVGRSEGPGRPLLYGTSEKFMDYFGLKSLDDLPKPKDFKTPDNEIGQQAPVDEPVDAGAPQPDARQEEE